MIDPQVLRRAIEHHQAGRHAEADAAYRECLARDPGDASVWNNFAVLALNTRDWEAALDRAARAVALQPDALNFHCTRAFALNGLGRAPEAIDLCHQLLQAHRDYAPAWFALGEALSRLGRDEEAAGAYRGALECKPDYAAAANNLGNLLSTLHDLDGAIAAYGTALQTLSSNAEIHNNLGVALREAGRHTEALDSLRRALEVDPHLAKAHSNLILALLYTRGTTSAELAEEGARWWRQHGAPVHRGDQRFPHDRNPHRPLRVGYVSPDFRDHPVGRHLAPLLREHDRERFFVTAYSCVRTPDRGTVELRASGVTWRNAAHLSDEALAAQIEADAIDILVDLSLHSADDRLAVFARQPAPVQISFAGYPGETGLESIAWHLTDRVLEPTGTGALYLPDSFWCIDPPADSPEVGALPALSGQPFVFGCLHKFAKVNPSTLERWCEILRALPESRLVMLCPPGEARNRVAAAISAHGVALERVELVSFQPRHEYLALHGRIDVILDTFPYNGHMTAIDALWMGVPLVSLAGELPVSRGGASILGQVGLGDLVAQTPEEYVRIAAALARDLPRLAALRATLRERVKSSPLMDGARFTRGVEAALRKAWQHWCAG